MDTIEKKKKRLELGRVTLAKEEMELRIDERLEEIERIKSNIKVQEKAMEKLTNEIKEM